MALREGLVLRSSGNMYVRYTMRSGARPAAFELRVGRLRFQTPKFCAVRDEVYLSDRDSRCSDLTQYLWLSSV